MDNGEPPTPSPQYSAPILNHSEVIVDEVDGVGNPEQNISPDSHLAFLLSSLTKSAMPTPALISDEIVTPNIPHSRIPQAEVPSLRPSASQSSVVARPPQSPSNASSHVRPSPTPSRSSNIHASSPFITSRSPVPQAVVLQTPVSPRTAKRNPGLSADISPYFTRSTPAAIPKQMKYLTMLENVAKESERMTPKLERQMQVMNGLLPPHTPHNIYPGLPVPGVGMSEPLSIHSSSPGVPVGSNFPPGFIPNSPQHDPFTVRPRTSNAFHPVPYPLHFPRASMNDEQLRFMMSGVSPRPPPAHAAGPLGPYPPPHLRMGYPLGHPAGPPSLAFQMAPPPLSQPSLRVVPTQFLPGAPSNEPGPLSAPPLSPSFSLTSRPNPSNNAHLLSILNTPNIPRAVTTVPRATTGSHA